MKLLLSFFILFSIFSFAEVATKSDILELKRDIRDNTKLLIELIKSETKANRDLIVANQKATNRRFEDIQRNIDKRFDMMFNFISLLFLIAVGQFWYLIKDRREIKKDVKEELELQLNLKADVKLVDSIITVLENFARTNKDIANVLKEHKFAVSK